MPLNRETLAQHFGDLWPVHNRAFTELLIECRRHFDGDMDQLLILSVIGDRMLTSNRARGLTYAQFMEGRRRAGRRQRINTQSVSDSTGIPRETVRRKIRCLVDRGWVKKNDDGMLEVTRKAAVDLAPATEASLDYFLTLGDALNTVTAKARERPIERIHRGMPR